MADTVHFGKIGVEPVRKTVAQRLNFRLIIDCAAESFALASPRSNQCFGLLHLFRCALKNVPACICLLKIGCACTGVVGFKNQVMRRIVIVIISTLGKTERRIDPHIDNQRTAINNVVG